MKRVISILLENKSGALARVVGLFHQRGYNIESLNVGPVFDGTYSRMTVTTRGSEKDVEQITKQIHKIIKNCLSFYRCPAAPAGFLSCVKPPLRDSQPLQTSESMKSS